MSFFFNPFTDEFKAPLLLSDRHYSPTFNLKGNAGRGKEVVVNWVDGPFNLSGNDSDGNAKKYLNFNFSLNENKNWASFQVDITTTAASINSVAVGDVVNALNANTTFSGWFTASVSPYYDTGSTPKILITQQKPGFQFRFYISNGQAESVLRFNARAGVVELPTYFARHTIANRFNYPDSQGCIIQLNPGTSNVDAAVIDGATDPYGNSLNYSHGTVQQDWQLLGGKSGMFQFTKGPSGNAVSTTDTQVIYSAGAVAGDLAEKVVTQKDASGNVVAQFVMPYTLTSGDLVTPP